MSLVEGLDLYDINIGNITYQLLTNNVQLLKMINKESIFQYHVPEANTEQAPIIRITMLSQLPTAYADNEQMAWDCLVQIDAWDSVDAFRIGSQINMLMKTINFKQSTPVFEYDEDTNLLRDGRRYEGIILADK